MKKKKTISNKRNIGSSAKKSDLKSDEIRKLKRELKIEAALEKVRARGMAMKKSDELGLLIGTLFKELTKLDLALTRCVIWIIDPKTNDAVWWMANSEDPSHPMSYIIPYHKAPPWLAFMKEWKKRTMKWAYDLKGQTKKKWDDHLFSKTGLSKMPKYIQTGMRTPNRVLLSASFNNFGGMNVASLEPLSDEHFNILLRFAKVFDQTYTRFLDLQKAEAQAREAEIELGLERVRARAMAMQNSDELAELVSVVFKELKHLDFALTSCIIWIHDHEHSIDTLWIASAEMNKPARPYQIKPFYNDFFRSIIHAWKAKDPKWVYALSGSKKKTFEKAFFKELPDLPNALKKALKNPNQVVFSASFNNFGALEIVETEPLTDEKFDILHRFGKVFNASYTRFNDLKKAEAQTREAQIEAALERVRSRTMAMHKTDELLDAAEIVHKELAALGINSMNVSYAFVDKDKKYGSYYSINPVDGKILPIPFVFPHTETDVMRSILASWKKQESFNVIELSVRATLKHQTYIGQHIQRQLAKNNIPFSIKDFLTISPPKAVLTTFNFTKGYLFNIGGERLSNSQEELMLRFTKVFEQTYIRFLDLQKAEAQARESEIQLALERVRARSLAMHKSEELTDVVKLLYKEFDNLKLSNESTDIEIGLIDEETGIAKVWAHLYLSDGSISTFSFPFAHFDEINHEFEKWKSTPIEKRNELFITTEFSGKDWNKFKKLAGDVPELAEMFESLIKANIKKWVTHNAYFSHGLLTLQGTEHYSPETLEIQKRFAKVFEQAYTRFLDLQKAEAQTREAQIEAALEKVRSRSLAMHKSDELKEVISEVQRKFQELDISMESRVAVVVVFDKNSRNFNQWVASPDFSNIYISTPYFQNPILDDFWSAKEGGVDFYSKAYPLEVKNSYFQFFFENSIYENVEGLEEQKKWLFEQAFYSYSPAFEKNSSIGIADFSGKPLTESDTEIIKRFAKVFEQAYVRFLDLQKAEAQAREAQIEAAMEKIRSRSLAMHNSKELKDIITVFFEKLSELNVLLGTIGIQFFDQKTMNSFLWVGNAIQDPQMVNMPYDKQMMQGDNLLKDMWSAKTNSCDIINKKYSREQKDKFFNYVFSNNDHTQVPEGARVVLRQLSNHIISLIIEKNSALFADSFTGEFFSDEQIKILKRAAKVFEQAYIRFLDLQKAEEQAREAEIELALERVRARTMAMQKSEELKEVIRVVYDQLVHIKIFVEHAGFIIDYKERDDMHIWLADQHEVPHEVIIPYFDSPHWNSFIEAKKKGKNFFANHLSFKEKNKFYKDLFKLFPVGEEAKKYYFSAAGLAISTVLLDNVGLYIENFSGTPYSDDENKVLMRFGRVFQQAYTRFLDLKKAEAQAREAQIQLALERVRARTMAMHKSDELPETSHILFEQMNELGVPAEQLTIGIVREELNVIEISATLQGNTLKKVYNHSIDEPYMINKVYKAWKTHQKTLIVELKGQDLNAYNQYRNELTQSDMFPTNLGNEDRRIVYAAFFSKGMLALGANEPCPPQSLQLLERFASVFDLTYTRFLDLQKAEAQAREAQIEASLERVRSRTMAMHSSKELDSVIKTVYSELKKLDVSFQRCFIMIFDEHKGATWWMGSPDDDLFHEGFYVQYHTHPPHLAYLKGWEERQQKWEYLLEGQIKKDWDEFIFTKTELSNLPAIVIQTMMSYNIANLSASFEKFGCMTTGGLEKLSDESFNILSRFAKVFDLSYTRFKDLQKAEMQAREAMIEAALERVRARAMAMHKSEDFNPAVKTIFEELEKLHLGTLRCGIGILHRAKRTADVWTIAKSEAGTYIQTSGDEPMDIHPLLQGDFDAWLRQEDYSYILEGKDLENYYQVLTETNFQLPEAASFHTVEKNYKQYYYATPFESGTLFAFRETEFTSEAKTVMKRFANVFNLTYKRFLDLQKAEAQAREAQIETSLERVRSTTMAMHKSEDALEVIRTLGEQLLALGFDIDVANFNCDYRSRDWNIWLWTVSTVYPGIVRIPYIDHPYFNKVIEAMNNGQDAVCIVFNKQEKDSFQKHFYQSVKSLASTERRNELINAEGFSTCVVFSKNTSVTIGKYTTRPFTNEQTAILKRFATAFEQAYTRFLDLQKAEAQARDAQIEVAVERVRAKALAMHKSEEMHGVVVTLKKELMGLNIPGITAATIYLQQDDGSIRVLDLSTGLEDKSELRLDKVFRIEDTDPKLWARRIWYGTEDYFVVEADEEDFKRVVAWLRTMNEAEADIAEKIIKEMSIKKAWLPTVRLEKGKLNIDLLQPPTPEIETILLKMGAGFDLAYKRFLDLQRAEAQARESQIELSLERIRAQAMAMNQSSDLLDIVVTMRNEFISLGHEAHYFWHMRWLPDKYEKAMTSGDGTRIGMVMELPRHIHGDISLLADWEKGNEPIVVYAMDADAAVEYVDKMIRLGDFKQVDPNAPSLDDIRHIGGLTFVMARTTHGEIGYSLPGVVPDPPKEDIITLKRFTDVFDLAYRRFEDLQKAEAQALQAEKDLIEIKAARKKAEETLAELQVTQKQLIQSEKMASLGELTAGIAHEIQNPLNFVNNFSEVSNELIDEMNAAIAKGEMEEAKAIADDIKQNLEKINHHGRRADAIVKSMLQHSRTSSGKKEPTDINALADEYLRLSYHGLRAKDKSFNARFETDFDSSIEKINVVPQEMGRVILNLINNAFYAVTERKKQQQEKYEPIVTVSTKQSNGTVEIKVCDNGNGIPQKVLDKIFQPFFTTKPTGEGTGLGLSLSYDIITKGHSGELKVETKEGVGSEFIIYLPIA